MGAGLLTLVAAATGCLNEPKRGTGDLGSDIQIQFCEAYGSPAALYPQPEFVGEPRLALELRTVEQYGCSNYTIVYQRTPTPNGVRLDLLGRHLGYICLTSIGPARARFFLDLRPGDHDLVLTKPDGGVAAFRVSVTPAAVMVTPDSSSFASAPSPRLWRHPARSCACYCGTTIETSWMCDDFVGRLRAAIPLEEFSYPDSGLAPYARQASGHWFDAPTRFFLYGSEADFARAQQVLQDYAANVIGTQQGIGISLHNWRNESCLSWLYDRTP